MQSNYIRKILNLEDVIVKKVIHKDSSVEFHIETKASAHICPCCGSSTKKIHDYCICQLKNGPRSNSKRVHYSLVFNQEIVSSNL